MGLGILVKVGGTADDELAAASLVEVHERMGEPTTFRIEYPIDIGGADITLLADARLAPGSELAVTLPLDGQEQALVWGPVYAHRIRLIHGGTDSTLEVIGGDKSVELDREVKMKIWDAVTTSDVVTSIASDYGLIADVEATQEQHIEEIGRAHV